MEEKSEVKSKQEDSLASGNAGTPDGIRNEERPTKLPGLVVPDHFLGGMTMTGCVLTRTGLELPDRGYSQEFWQSVGLKLKLAVDCTHFWRGDWYNAGSRRYGSKRAEEIARQVGYSPKTIANEAWVTGQIENSRRRENVSYGKHAEVAGLPKDVQDRWLDLIAAKQPSRKLLRASIAASKETGKIELLPTGVKIRQKPDPWHTWELAQARPAIMAFKDRLPTLKDIAACKNPDDWEQALRHVHKVYEASVEASDGEPDRKKSPDSRRERFNVVQEKVSEAKAEAEALRAELRDEPPTGSQETETAIASLDEFIKAMETAEGVEVDFPPSQEAKATQNHRQSVQDSAKEPVPEAKSDEDVANTDQPPRVEAPSNQDDTETKPDRRGKTYTAEEAHDILEKMDAILDPQHKDNQPEKPTVVPAPPVDHKDMLNTGEARALAGDAVKRSPYGSGRDICMWNRFVKENRITKHHQGCQFYYDRAEVEAALKKAQLQADGGAA